jgi:hypothetical protein
MCVIPAPDEIEVEQAVVGKPTPCQVAVRVDCLFAREREAKDEITSREAKRQPVEIE